LTDVILRFVFSITFARLVVIIDSGYQVGRRRLHGSLALRLEQSITGILEQDQTLPGAGQTPAGHMGELFAFVRVDGLDADINRAERLPRPVVVQRKISGGARSPAGSATRLALASLFETWHARGLNPCQECLTLLHSRCPQI
jgi:hypothetical protein